MPPHHLVSSQNDDGDGSNRRIRTLRPGGLQGAEPFRERRCVLQCLVPRLGIRVVVGNRWPGMGTGHTKIIQKGRDGLAGHRRSRSACTKPGRGGLQIWSPAGEWEEAPYDPEAFTINTGEA